MCQVPRWAEWCGMPPSRGLCIPGSQAVTLEPLGTSWGPQRLAGPGAGVEEALGLGQGRLVSQVSCAWWQAALGILVNINSEAARAGMGSSESEP